MLAQLKLLPDPLVKLHQGTRSLRRQTFLGTPLMYDTNLIAKQNYNFRDSRNILVERGQSNNFKGVKTHNRNLYLYQNVEATVFNTYQGKNVSNQQI